MALTSTRSLAASPPIIVDQQTCSAPSPWTAAPPSCTFTWGNAAPASGQLAIACLIGRQAESPTVMPTVPTGWTALYTSVQYAYTSACYWHAVAAGETQFTFTSSATATTNSELNGVAYRFINGGTSAPGFAMLANYNTLTGPTTASTCLTSGGTCTGAFDPSLATGLIVVMNGSVNAYAGGGVWPSFAITNTGNNPKYWSAGAALLEGTHSYAEQSWYAWVTGVSTSTAVQMYITQPNSGTIGETDAAIFFIPSSGPCPARSLMGAGC
jgi:hypothetical protein